MNTRRRILDVHIIESNRPTEPIAEGMALTSILKISDIEAHPYVVGTRADLKAAVATIAAHPRCIPHHRHFLPFFHFALHATRRGILLRGKELIQWPELLTIMTPLRERLQGNLLIAMSACEGFFGFRLACCFERYTYYFLVGPRTRIDWRDSLLAYHVFYHSLFFRRAKPPKAVDAMNRSLLSRSYAFDYTLGPEVQRNFKKYLSIDEDIVAMRLKAQKLKTARSI